MLLFSYQLIPSTLCVQHPLHLCTLIHTAFGSLEAFKNHYLIPVPYNILDFAYYKFEHAVVCCLRRP